MCAVPSPPSFENAKIRLSTYVKKKPSRVMTYTCIRLSLNVTNDTKFDQITDHEKGPAETLFTHVERIPSLPAPVPTAEPRSPIPFPIPIPPILAKLSPILTPRFMFIEAIMFMAFKGVIAPAAEAVEAAEAAEAAAAAAFQPPSLDLFFLVDLINLDSINLDVGFSVSFSYPKISSLLLLIVDCWF